MKSPYSSSWDSTYNLVDDSSGHDLATTRLPLPNSLSSLESLPAQDVSLSSLLPEFFVGEAVETESTPKPELNLTNPVTLPPPSQLPLSTSEMYALLVEQEQEDLRREARRERQQLFLKIGAIAIVIFLVALLLIIGVITQMPPKLR